MNPYETQVLAEKLARRLGVITPIIRLGSRCHFNGNAHCHIQTTNHYRRGTICINPNKFLRMDSTKQRILIIHEVSHLKPRKNHTHNNRTYTKAYKELMVGEFPLAVRA